MNLLRRQGKTSPAVLALLVFSAGAALGAGGLFLWEAFAPREFPAPGLLYRDPLRSFSGYTLVTPLRGSAVHLLDDEGREVRRWTIPGVPSPEEQKQDLARLFFSGVLQAKLLPGGNLLVGHGEADVAAKWSDGGSMSVLKEFDPSGNIVWEYRNEAMHNDFARLSDGRTAVIVWEELPREFAARVEGGVPGAEAGGERQVMLSDALIEIDRAGNELWRWSLKDHLDPADPRNHLKPGMSRSVWTHMDSIQYLEENPLTGTPAYLVSINLLDTVAIVERETGAILWRWGTGVLAGQHSAVLGRDGIVFSFDNGRRRGGPHPFSRIVGVDVKSGEVAYLFAPGALAHDRATFYSSINGSVQELPNGNLLVSAGMKGRVFEIAPGAGRVVWDYMSPYGRSLEGWPSAVQNAVYSAYRYPAEYVR